jgi:hypothetical protein
MNSAARKHCAGLAQIVRRESSERCDVMLEKIFHATPARAGWSVAVNAPCRGRSVVRYYVVGIADRNSAIAAVVGIVPAAAEVCRATALEPRHIEARNLMQNEVTLLGAP